MRLASMILGLMLSAWCFFEAFLVSLLDTNSVLSADDKDMAAAAGGGLVTALIGALASALAIAFPLASTCLFSFAGAVSLITASMGYENHWGYGPILFVLAIMSFFGWRGKRKQDREREDERIRQHQRDQMLVQMMQQQQRQQAETH